MIFNNTGDEFHPPENVAKMASGEPLDDTDRRPWLAALAGALKNEAGAVAACSALKRSCRSARICRRQVAATPRLPRVYSVETSRGDAAAATWIYR